MRLSCKRGMQIAIYSAMFGRTQQGTLECPLYHRRAPSVGERTFHLQNFSAGSGTLCLCYMFQERSHNSIRHGRTKINL